MGNDQTSLAVPRHPPDGMFCISLQPKRMIHLVNAPPSVAVRLQRVANEVNSLYYKSWTGKDFRQTPTTDKLGVIQFDMAADVFGAGSGKKAATMGKLFCIKIIEDLHKTGYDLQISSDLMRTEESASTLFFKKVTSERRQAKVICVGLGSSDRITLINHNDGVKTMVEKAIQDTWPSGVQSRKKEEVLGHVLHEFKMNGNPWRVCTSTCGIIMRPSTPHYEQNIDSIRIVIKIIENLSKINLRLVSGVNIKGHRDSLTLWPSTRSTLFFIEDFTTSTAQFCSISLCKKNRLRLVDCKEETKSIRQVINRSGFNIKEASEGEHHAKLKLDGSPFHSSWGPDAVATRQLVSRIGEAMMQQGWALTGAIDIERWVDTKSTLLFRRCPPAMASIACICLTSDNQLRLVDFSPGDQVILKACVTENYRPGVDGVDIRPLEPESKGRSLIFDLAGIPWDSWDWGLHARHLLLHLFATLFNLGYQITASADVSSEFATDAQNVPISPLDVHSIFLVKMHTQPAAGALSEAEQIVTEFGEHPGSGPPTYEEAMWPHV